MLSCCPTVTSASDGRGKNLPEFAVDFSSGVPFAVLITGLTLVGLWVSNLMYDRGVPHYISRKIGHGAGGMGFLLILVFFRSAFWPLLLAGIFGLLLLVASLARPLTFRGVGGSGRSDRAFAEVYFPWVAVPVFAIGWLWLDRPELAAASLLFMAWGDGLTGLVRSQVYHKAVKGLWGSAAMLAVCLVLSWILVTPFWIGAAASLAATATEWTFGDVGKVKWLDDNLAIPLVSLGLLLGLMRLSGNL